MSDTAAALKAAREVQADTLAPELYRQGNEWFFKAKNEYRLKNFKEAREDSMKARRYAEQAEFEAIRNGAARNDISPAEPPPEPEASPYAYPSPEGAPADELEQKESQGTAPSPRP